MKNIYFTDQKYECAQEGNFKPPKEELPGMVYRELSQNAVHSPSRNEIIDYCNRFSMDEFKAANMNLSRQEYLQGLTHLRSLPQKFIVDISSRCNLSCPLCFTGAGLQKKPAQFMSFELYKSIIDKVKKYATWIWLFNWGESLLHPNVAQMIKLAADARISTQISSNLNLQRKDEFWESLVKAPLHQLIVSFDGLEQMTYEKYRARGDLSLVIQNIKTLVNLKKRLNSVLPVIELQFLVHKYNIHEQEEVFNIGQELGVDNVYCSELTLPFGCHDSDLARKWLVPDVLNNWDFYDMDEFMLQGDRCEFLYNFMVIEPDGSLPPCCYTNFPEHNFGFWDENKTLSEIWNSEKFITARTLFSDLNNSMIGLVCEECSAYKRYSAKLKNHTNSINTKASASGKADKSNSKVGDWYTQTTLASPNSVPKNEEQATVRKIENLLRNKKWQAAQQTADMGVNNFSSSAKLKNLKMVIDVRNGDIRTGKNRLLEVLKQDPSICEALNILGEIEYQQGNLESAREFFKSVVAIDALYDPAADNLTLVDNSTLTSTP